MCVCVCMVCTPPMLDSVKNGGSFGAYYEFRFLGIAITE